MIKSGRLIVYSGPSGVGKGTLIAPLLLDERGTLKMSVSATTRSPRVGEQDGVHYHFFTREQFEEMIENDEMLEYTEYNGNYYGTPRKFVEQMLAAGRDVVLEIEVKGAACVRQNFPDALMVFIMPPSFAELERRLASRGTETTESVQNRLKIALDEIAQASNYDYIIVNEDLKNARKQFLEVVSAAGALARFNLNLIDEVLRDAKTSNE